MKVTSTYDKSHSTRPPSQFSPCIVCQSTFRELSFPRFRPFSSLIIERRFADRNVTNRSYASLCNRSPAIASNSPSDPSNFCDPLRTRTRFNDHLFTSRPFAEKFKEDSYGVTMSRVAQEIARRVGSYLDRLLREASGLTYLVVLHRKCCF